MTRRCGNCLWHEKVEGKVGWCHGAPPTVTGVSHHDDGTINVRAYSPLIAENVRPCSLHRYRWGWRGLWWRLTGGKVG